MGRHAEGWKLEWRGKPGREYGYVRFTHATKQYLVSTGTRDPERASVEAARIYSRTISGQAARSARRRNLVARPLTELFAEWLASLEGTLDDETSKTYRVTYAGKHWPAHYLTIEDMCSDSEREKYRTNRLRKASAKTVQKECWAQDKFLRWCKKVAKVVEQVPERLEWEKTVLGTRVGKQREKAVELTPEQVRDILAALPVWYVPGKRASKHRKAYPICARFVVAYETGLRPATLSALKWSNFVATTNDGLEGSTLSIQSQDDKIRFGRIVPLTPRARYALALTKAQASRHGIDVGPDAKIFGDRQYRKTWRRACKAAGVPKASPYDLRHARATHLANAGAALTGIAYTLGHKQLTTTNRYLHPGFDASQDALSRGILGQPPQLPEKTGWPSGFEPPTPGATRQRYGNSFEDLVDVGDVVEAAECRSDPPDTQHFRVSDLENPGAPDVADAVRWALRAIHCGQRELAALAGEAALRGE